VTLPRAAGGWLRYGLARLIAVKDNWDSDNTFHLNHNIRPTSHPAGPSVASGSS
jgi:hypothetical protein